MAKDKPSTTPKQTKTTGKKSRSAISDVVAREYTIHLHKRVCPPYPTYVQAVEEEEEE